jgi:hypothetical protein
LTTRQRFDLVETGDAHGLAAIFTPAARSRAETLGQQVQTGQQRQVERVDLRGPSTGSAVASLSTSPPSAAQRSRELPLARRRKRSEIPEDGAEDFTDRRTGSA